jgi:hypothetical protein
MSGWEPADERDHRSVRDLRNAFIGEIGRWIAEAEREADDAAARGGGGGGGGTGFVPTTIDSGTVDPGDYNVRVEFKGSGWTQALYDAYVEAVNWIESYIAGDVPNVLVRSRNTVISVDDITITAEIKVIDGIGKILGQAGPTTMRTGSYLPATATMQFDTADANNLLSSGRWDEVVKHEMLHCIGFGSIWSYKGLLADTGTATPHFTGAAATAEYRAITGDPTATIRVEDGGGSGTALSHWDEETFGSELMTGYLGYTDANGDYALPPSNPLSSMTVESLADLGYVLEDRGTWKSVANDWVLPP